MLWSSMEVVAAESGELVLLCDRTGRSLLISPGRFPESEAAFAYACHMLEIGRESWAAAEASE